MFHWFSTITNTRGDALPAWQVGLVNVDTQNVVPIFADENSTPIATISGVANRAVADENGNYFFFVPSGTYSLQFFNPAGALQRTQRYVPMYGAPSAIPVSSQSGTSYTLAFNDAGSVVQFTNGAAVTLTIPPDSDVNIPVGSGIEVHQMGAGQVTFAAGSGVTLRVRSSFTKTAGQYAIAGIRKIAADTWILTGDLA